MTRRTPSPTHSGDEAPERLTTAELARQAGALPLEDLAGAMLVGGFTGTEPPASLLRLVHERRMGGVILFSRNYRTPRQVRDLLDELRSVAASPGALLAAVDQEGGPVARFGDPFTRIPAMARLGEVGDEGLALKVGRLLAVELGEVGVNLDFAPVVDVLTRPDNPAIGRRALGSDPERVARLGASLILGMQSRGLAACAKHFPGHGDAAVDSHHALPVIEHSVARLSKVELCPFRRACGLPVASVMMAHLLVPALDATLPTSLSPAVIDGLLRRDLGYDGVVVSDDLEMGAIAGHFGMAEVARLGLEAGLDLFLVCHRADRQEELLDAVLELVARGEVPRERLERSWIRLERLKTDYPPPSRPFEPHVLGAPLHRRLAEELE